MSKVWYCIPSARPAAEVQPVVDAWRAQGYKVALWRDANADLPDCDYWLWGGECPRAGREAAHLYAEPYPGYAQAVNRLAKHVLMNQDVQWIVTGGDDTLPDPNKRANEIADELTAHFGGTFGVCQPTGDRWANGSIDRIAGSPWLGREWCERANGGQGPFWPEFTHMFGDQALKETAEKVGVYLMRPDLTHMHNHFLRQGENVNRKAEIPPHLVKWNSQAHWNEMKAIYLRLKGQGFAPCMPLPVEVLA